jgi:hypothetical protein
MPTVRAARKIMLNGAPIETPGRATSMQQNASAIGISGKGAWTARPAAAHVQLVTACPAHVRPLLPDLMEDLWIEAGTRPTQGVFGRGDLFVGGMFGPVLVRQDM